MRKAFRQGRVFRPKQRRRENRRHWRRRRFPKRFPGGSRRFVHRLQAGTRQFVGRPVQKKRKAGKGGKPPPFRPERGAAQSGAKDGGRVPEIAGRGGKGQGNDGGKGKGAVKAPAKNFAAPAFQRRKSVPVGNKGRKLAYFGLVDFSCSVLESYHEI